MPTLDTETTTEEFRQALPADAPKAEEQLEDEKDPTKVKQRQPPSRGLCRRCGQNKPINRLMLCYPCWVKTELEEHGWREGMPHPGWCRCEGLAEHGGKAYGN